MKYSKDFYQAIKINEFYWRGFINGLHYFSNGKLWCKATDEDIEDGNLTDMIRLGVSK